jgi:CTP:molybdopterin cytidylyltransferase MocA
MASSFAAGLAALPPVDAALAWPVDHPLVAVATVRALVDADGAIVVPTFAARGGHPTRFAAALFPACIAAAGAPDGLRAVLRDHAAGVRRLTIDDAGVVRDVDSTDDYARIKDDGRR